MCLAALPLGWMHGCSHTIDPEWGGVGAARARFDDGHPGRRTCRRVKMTRLRARVAERLKGAQNTYAMLTTFNEIDMTNLMKLRTDFKARRTDFTGCLSADRASRAPCGRMSMECRL